MRLVLTTCVLALAACGGGNDKDKAAGSEDAAAPASQEQAGPAADTQPLPEIVSPLVSAPPLTPGAYCYYRSDENVTEGLEIEVSEDGQVSGDNFGVIHQRAASYFASFTTSLENGVLGETSSVTFDTQTEVDGDSQSASAIWYLTDAGAVPDGLDTTLEPVDCEGLEARVQNEGTP